VSSHLATIRWQRHGQLFTDNKYSRGHVWKFDGGAVVQASASPDIVALPMSVAENVDPEEAFIASLASCHMLIFLAVAAKRRFIVDDYVDKAIGEMASDEQGRMSIVRVTLRPRVTWSGEKKPTKTQLEKMHHQSHKMCFIANSVKTIVETDLVS